MTDLRALLHAAAPTPSRAIDVDALMVEAARRRPWRRIALWFGSMAVVFGLGAGSTVVLNPAGDGTAVDTRPSPRPTTVETDGTDAGDDSDGTDDRVLFEAASSDGGSAEESTATTTTAPAHETDEPRPPAKEPSGPSEGCHVDAGGTGVATPEPIEGGAGYDDSKADRCRYVARRAGGYWGSGSWSVTIERGGKRYDYAHYLDSPPCAADGIQPGDVVTVSVRTAGATADGEVHAGPEVDCSYEA